MKLDVSSALECACDDAFCFWFVEYQLRSVLQMLPRRLYPPGHANARSFSLNLTELVSHHERDR